MLPMFPLGTVLLPGQLLPLHIFEDRYQLMLRLVQESQPPIFGVVLIARGSEVGGDDTRTSVGTCARVLRVQQLDEGRSAIIVGGTNRVRIVEWLPDDPFPQARIADFPDRVAEGDHDAIDRIYPLHRRVCAVATEMGFGQFSASPCDTSDPSLALYTMIAESPLGVMDRQQLLETSTLSQRLTRFGIALQEFEEILLMEMQRNAD